MVYQTTPATAVQYYDTDNHPKKELHGALRIQVIMSVDTSTEIIYTVTKMLLELWGFFQYFL